MKLLLLKLSAFFALLICTIGLQVLMAGIVTDAIFYQHFDEYTTFGWVVQIIYWLCSITICWYIAMEVEE